RRSVRSSGCGLHICQPGVECRICWRHSSSDSPHGCRNVGRQCRAARGNRARAGLGFAKRRRAVRNPALGRRRVSYMARHPGLASCRYSKAITRQRRRQFFARLYCRCVKSKTIGFFTAFLPQFIDPYLPVVPQLAVMCLVSALLAAFSDALWAVASGLSRAWLMKPARAKLLGRMSGAVLIGGGIWLSLARAKA